MERSLGCSITALLGNISCMRVDNKSGPLSPTLHYPTLHYTTLLCPPFVMWKEIDGWVGQSTQAWVSQIKSFFSFLFFKIFQKNFKKKLFLCHCQQLKWGLENEVLSSRHFLSHNCHFCHWLPQVWPKGLLLLHQTIFTLHSASLQ